MSKKGIKSLLFKNKFSYLKSIDFNFCEDYVHGKQKRMSFSKTRVKLRPKKLELVHTNLLSLTVV